MSDELKSVFSSMRAFPGGVRSKKRSSRILSGEHRSLFLGRGLDFYRKVEYNPLEHSIDQISWHDTADPDKVYVREAILLKQEILLLVLDFSSSMDFGVKAQRKLKLMLEASGTVGLTAAHDHDKVGLVGFTDRIVMEKPVKAGYKRIYHLIREVYSFFASALAGPERSTNLNNLFGFLAKRFRHRSLIFVFSDFIGWENIAVSPLLGSLASRHEVVFVILDDPEEFELKGFFGTIQVRNLEDKKDVVNVPVRHFKRIRREMLERRRKMREDLNRLGIDSVELAYGDHVNRLAGFFEERRRR